MTKAGLGRQEVPVTDVLATQVHEDKQINVFGHSFSVSYLRGDAYDPQSTLIMHFDDKTVNLYDPNGGLSTVVSDDGVQLQCGALSQQP